MNPSNDDIKNLRVIIVDDSQSIFEIVSESLREIEINNIDRAENGQIGFEKITDAANNSNPYNIAFIDWSMPVMNGFELVKKLRSNKIHANTKLIMLTVDDEKDHIMKALLAGVDYYLMKEASSVLVPKIKTVVTKVMSSEKS